MMGTRENITSVTIAEKIASVGTGQASQAEHLPLPTAALHQATSQAFVDALHGAFLIAALSLLVAALLVAFLLRARQPAIRTSIEVAGLPIATEALITEDRV